MKNKILRTISENQSQYSHFAELGKELGHILIAETPLPIMLQQCAELLNSYLGTFLLRIWLIAPTEDEARLIASAGEYPRLTGKHKFKKLDKNNIIGRIAAENKAYVTNHLEDDPLILDQEWVREKKVKAFAGFPLQTNGHTFGVIACFKQQAHTKEEISLLQPLVDEIALGIARKQSEIDLQKSHANLEKNIIARTNEMTEIHVHMLHSEKLAAIGRLSASIAHEFNNPLAGITSVIQGVKRRATYDEEDGKLIDMALKDCDRIKKLIQSLHDFNRPNPSTKGLIDLPIFFDSLLLLNQYEFKRHGIILIKNFTSTPQLMAVSDQLKQVFLNILSNAIEACHHGDIITITTKSDSAKCTISIADTGIGIRKEDMNHIFEPFFSTKKEVRGIGLGLPVCFGIIKNQGGEIEVESKRAQGTTVSVILPIT